MQNKELWGLFYTVILLQLNSVKYSWLYVYNAAIEKHLHTNFCLLWDKKANLFVLVSIRTHLQVEVQTENKEHWYNDWAIKYHLFSALVFWENIFGAWLQKELILCLLNMFWKLFVYPSCSFPLSYLILLLLVLCNDKK